MADGERQHRPRDGHVEQPPLLVQRAFNRRARVRQQPVLQPDDVHARKLQSLAAVHGDERDDVAFFLLLFPVGVERDVLEECLQPLEQRLADGIAAIQRGGQVAQIADAGFAGFSFLFLAAQFMQVAGLVEKMIRPGLQDLGLVLGGRVGQGCPRALHKLHERRKAFLRPLLEARLHQRVFHGGEHRALTFLAGGQQPLHRHVAQPPGGGVGDPQEADVVMRVNEHLEIGEEIPDLAPVEKALPADQVIAHARLAQRRFNRTRLDIGAEQDRILLPRNAVRQPGEFNLPHQLGGLLLLVAAGAQQDLRALALLRPQLLGPAARVVFDQRVGGRQDRVGRAVVLLELDDLHLGIMFFQIEQVGDLRAAPAVNALVVVAHHAEVAMLQRQRVDQLELRAVGVLILVRHDIAVFGAAGLQHVGKFIEQPQRQQDQVIEIHGVAGAQGGFVARADVLGQRAHAGVRERRRGLAPVLELAQQGENSPGVGLFALGRDAAQNFFHGRELLGFVVDDEVALVAEGLDVGAQDADAQGMERAQGRALGRFPVALPGLQVRQQLVDALLHLARGLVREGDGQDVLRRDALVDEVRDAVGDDARLAGARPGQDQNRAVKGLSGLALLRIQ